MKVENFVMSGVSAITKPKKALNKPLHLQVEPTSRCNLNCYFCSRLNSIKDGKGSDMPFEDFAVLLKAVKPLRVTFAGRGEPLLNSNLTRMIKETGTHGAKSIVTTNFTLGEKCAETLVLSGLDILRISIDAASRDVYRKIRGRDFFDKILNGIKLLNDIKKSRGSNLPTVGFEFVMTQDNIHQLIDLIKLSGGIGVERINFRPLGLVGIEDRSEMLMGHACKEQFRHMLGEAELLSKQIGITTNIARLLKDMDFYWNRYDNRLPSKQIGCLYLWLQIFVSAEGEMTPCCALFMDEGVSMGNVFDKGFESVWNGENFKAFRKKMKHGHAPYQSCKVCIPKNLGWLYKKVRLIGSR